MNFQSFLPGLKIWFENYIKGFSSDNPVIQENIDLKKGHTLRVCEVIVNIGTALELSQEDLCLAESSALLHDIGRFEQYQRYGTFSDYRSEDHAALGVKIIRSNKVLQGSNPAEVETIIRLVEYHNRASLPVNETTRFLFFLKLLRDADKIDIWRVVTDYYQNGMHSRNRSIELDLPDEPTISENVYRALMNEEVVQTADLKTFNDFKLLQIGWIYDVNFSKTFQIIRGKRYLEKIRAVLPRSSSPVDEIYSKARSYLEKKASVA